MKDLRGHPPYAAMFEQLEERIGEVLKHKKRALVTVAGKGGTGKSYLARYIRKKGINSRFGRSSCAVIDDNALKSYFLCFFKREVKIPLAGVDELMPFLENIPETKKIVFFMNATPWKRITRTDILIKLAVDEETRRRRLSKRYADDPATLEKAIQSAGCGAKDIEYTYLLEVDA